MSTKKIALLVLTVALGLAVLLSGCGPTSKAASPKPERVVENFYQWYLDYEGNQLVDGAYRSSEYLTEEFVQQVDGIIASFDKGGYDPFLCAQDVPGSFTVDKATVLGDTASVVLHEVWNPGTEYESVHDVTVVLHKMDGVWRIATVLCPGVGSTSEVPGAQTMAPEQVVESFYQEGPVPTIATPPTLSPPEEVAGGFYGWYVWYAQEVGNPLVDGAYRSSEYLTEAFIQKVDGIIASFDKGGYDPFLCAQDIPESLTISEAKVSGGTATVQLAKSWNLGTLYQSTDYVTIQLQLVDGKWLISDVWCLE